MPPYPSKPPNHQAVSSPLGRSPWNPRQRDQISYHLSQQLGPEYIAYRQGNGGIRVPYLEGWKVINLANEVFGFDGWTSEVMSQSMDYLDEVNGRVSLGLSVVVRVTLKSGTYHEDVGYGHIDNARSKSMAFEKCKKEATTDGMKRALRLFGNVLGNCLYDSTYMRNVSRVKTTFDNAFNPDRLKRRPECDPSKVTSTTTPTSNSGTGETGSTTTHHTPVSNDVPSADSISGPSANYSNSNSNKNNNSNPNRKNNGDEDPVKYERLLNSSDFLSDYSDDLDWNEIDGLPAVKEEANLSEHSRPKSFHKEQDILSSSIATELPQTFFKIGDLKDVKPNTPIKLEQPFDAHSASPAARRTVQDRSIPIKRLSDPSEPSSQPTPLRAVSVPRLSQVPQQRSTPPSEVSASALNIMRSPDKRQKTNI